MSTRAAARAAAALEASRKAANLERVRRFRDNQANKKSEYINRIYQRVKEGAIPHANSLLKYNITLDKINDLRRLANLAPVPASHIPYFSRNIGQPEPVIPDISEAPRVFNEEADENEVQGAERPIPDAQPQLRTVRRTSDFSVGAISVYLQKNRPISKGSDNKPNSDGTINAQFGRIDKQWNNTGNFYNFMKMLGEEYVEDVSLIERPSFPDFLKQKLNEKQVGGRKTELKLKTKLMHFETLLKVLKWYPGFDAVNYLNTNNRRFERAYQNINRVHHEMKMRVGAEELIKPDGKPVMEWNELKRKVLAKYPDKTSAENIYIRLYTEEPSRNDFQNLFVDDNPDTREPRNELELELVKQNTIYIKPNMKRARLIIVKYKTAITGGTRDTYLSEGLKTDIRTYINKTQTTSSSNPLFAVQTPIASRTKNKFLFGTGNMSTFVGKILDSIGLTKDKREGSINALRKSFVSSEMAKFTGTAQERVDLALIMKHLPTTSLKYARGFMQNKTLDDVMESLDDEELEALAAD